MEYPFALADASSTAVAVNVITFADVLSDASANPFQPFAAPVEFTFNKPVDVLYHNAPTVVVCGYVVPMCTVVGCHCVDEL